MERVLELLLTGARQARGIRYGFAAALAVLTILARLGLDPVLPGYTFILFYPSLYVAALLFGRGPGVLTIVMFSAASAFFWFEPRFSLAVARPQDFLALMIFVLSGLIAVAITEALHVVLSRSAAADQEKDLLLRELHHRIRNDLQGIASILYMAQSGRGETAATIERAQARIGILSSVYARLRRDRGAPKVDAQEYLRQLVDDLRAAAAGMRPVGIQASIENAVLGIGCAVSLGIVINELVTNSIKYAFPDDRAGTITVKFHREGEDFVLCVSDDGVGITSAVPKGTGLGAMLLRQLAVQLSGTMETENENGVRTVLRFPVSAAAA